MEYPHSAFNFKVRLQIDGESSPICDGAFSEVSGLEMTMEAQTIREGGNNARPIHLVGPIAYGQLTLKRGMTASTDLWRWFREVDRHRSKRASGEIVMLSADRSAETVRFSLTGCLPLMLKAPTLNALDGILAIEEMQVAYETLDLESPA
jgi:phage tail-like protein